MKQRFILFRRAGIFYSEDTTTRKQTSLRARGEVEAIILLNTKNEATRQPAMNTQIAQVYLQHSDPSLAARTWQHVMEQVVAELSQSLTNGERMANGKLPLAKAG